MVDSKIKKSTHPTRAASMPRRSARSTKEPTRLTSESLAVTTTPTTPRRSTPVRAIQPSKGARASSNRGTTPTTPKQTKRASLPMTRRGMGDVKSTTPSSRGRTSSRRPAAQPPTPSLKKTPRQGTLASATTRKATAAAARSATPSKKLARGRNRAAPRSSLGRPAKHAKPQVNPEEARSLIGKHISMCWPGDDKYYNAMVLAFDEKSGDHKLYYYPTDDAGEQVEVVSLYNKSRTWKPLMQDPTADAGTAPEDPYALVGSRISVEWPDRLLGEQKMHRCEAVVVKYNAEKSYRVVYIQDDYCEDRDLSAPNDLPWQMVTDPVTAQVSGPWHMVQDPQGGSALPENPVPNELESSRIADITSDTALERQLEFEAPMAVDGPSDSAHASQPAVPTQANDPADAGIDNHSATAPLDPKSTNAAGGDGVESHPKSSTKIPTDACY